ncbi:MAG: hypothetical protein KGI67_06715 [Pseudomonadota bacterium]|nr:hypothetical protein [Pseudomonadota bacterium]
MADEKIKVRITETDAEIEVVVLRKQATRIEVVLGSGVHSVRCELVPNRAESAYFGRAMGREIVYERSRKQVQADIDRVSLPSREFRRH